LVLALLPSILLTLQVLSGEILPRERGRMRFHAIQNVETALRFLRFKSIFRKHSPFYSVSSSHYIYFSYSFLFKCTGTRRSSL
jgi:hypothetical protein